jgi:uncharacterized membrane protein YcaP (DUF421 family)
METVLRVGAIYLFLLVALRVMGKREFSELSSIEFVTLLLIPELMQQAMIRQDYSLTNALIGATTLLTLTFLTSLVTHLSKRAEQVIGGIPVVLVKDGNLLEDAMNRERVSPDEIFAQMHKGGLTLLEQVRWAILLTDGKIAIIPAEGETTTPSEDEDHAAT